MNTINIVMLTQAQRDALGFLAATDSLRGLHYTTLSGLYPYYRVRSFLNDPPGSPYIITQQGMVHARRSRIWLAHDALSRAGYILAPGGKPRPGYIAYAHQDDQADWAINCRGKAWAAPTGRLTEPTRYRDIKVTGAEVAA